MVIHFKAYTFDQGTQKIFYNPYRVIIIYKFGFYSLNKFLPTLPLTRWAIQYVMPKVPKYLDWGNSFSRVGPSGF
jgi:hypothetical protein